MMPLAVTVASERATSDRQSSDRQGSDKQPGAFRTIGEVAEDLDTPQHVLRFWESRFAQIRPLKRGGNRRYYRPEDVDLLRGVKHLLHGQGYTIRGAQRVLKQNGVRFVQAVGRGEAQVERPAPTEREPEHEAGEGSIAPAASRDDPTGAPMSSAHAALAAALDDLRACRALLAGLGLDEADRA